MSEYGAIDRALHRVSLAHPAVAEMAFALEQTLYRAPAAGAGRHLYVAGLARAGTTILMRRIHASGEFRSLTYGDMPFILAPNLWRSMRRGRAVARNGGPRAHDDGIFVDTESPESFEEVFWRTFAGDDYIGPTRLRPHEPGDEVLDRYRSFVASVLRAGDARRYLCKNNNNILRLPAIKAAFPNAILLIPYRRPLEQAASLLQQHIRFTAIQRSDRFADAYMTWLVHHEFGASHRPFDFGGASAHPPETLAYWLDQWIAVHDWLRASAPADAIWVRYEALCDDPACWNGIADRIDVPREGGTTEFRRAAPKQHDVGELPDGLLQRAEALYAELPVVV